MVMKNIAIKTMTLPLVLLLTFSSCSRFLEVKPEDRVLEDQLFSSSKGIRSVLNGLYINLAKQELYGQNLTLSTTEILAQRYNIPSTHSLSKVATYAYNENLVSSRMDAIWSSSYSLILNTNAFLENLKKYEGVLPKYEEALYRGEALAMRAFLHFDLFRMFGPQYAVDPAKSSLPYYSSSQSKMNPLLAADEFVGMLLTDLDEAELLLAGDDVVTNGVNPRSTSGGIDFYSTDRNYRLNYYAVKGLKARLYLYIGDKVNALKYAKEVIAVKEKFPWTTVTNALVEKQNPDRVFSTEMLFGIMDTQLYNSYLQLFDPSIHDNDILAPILDRINSTFENNENDYRFNLNWVRPSTGIKEYKTFVKYADIVEKEKNFRFTIPLLKISEIFYIAAECESANDEALSYLNEVRINRGLPNLNAGVDLSTEIRKEYEKEFFGEGQLYFFFKRKNITSIPNGSSKTGTVTVNFAIPMPQSEIIYRN